MVVGRSSEARAYSQMSQTPLPCTICITSCLARASKCIIFSFRLSYKNRPHQLAPKCPQLSSHLLITNHSFSELHKTTKLENVALTEKLKIIFYIHWKKLSYLKIYIFIISTENYKNVIHLVDFLNVNLSNSQTTHSVWNVREQAVSYLTCISVVRAYKNELIMFKHGQKLLFC